MEAYDGFHSWMLDAISRRLSLGYSERELIFFFNSLCLCFIIFQILVIKYGTLLSDCNLAVFSNILYLQYSTHAYSLCPDTLLIFYLRSTVRSSNPVKSRLRLPLDSTLLQRNGSNGDYPSLSSHGRLDVSPGRLKSQLRWLLKLIPYIQSQPTLSFPAITRKCAGIWMILTKQRPPN